jgi:hypothetical protein
VWVVGWRHEVELRDDAELALAVDEQLAVALERGDAGIEEMLLPARDVEPRSDLGRRERHAGFRERAQDRLARRPRVRNVGPAVTRIGARIRRGAPAKRYRF